MDTLDSWTDRIHGHIRLTDITTDGYCARHNFSYTRGWMQMVFYCHMIYSPETDRHSKTWFTITVIKDMTDYCTQYCMYTYDTYSVHKGGLMLCRACPSCLPASWERLTSSTVWWVPHLPQHSRWPRFPQGPCTSLSHCPLQIFFIKQYMYRPLLFCRISDLGESDFAVYQTRQNLVPTGLRTSRRRI